MKKGLLLINIGTPESPNPNAVSKYLKQFLMDPYVIDIRKFWRWVLVNILIVPRRKYRSADQYKLIWMEEGSPLLVHSKKLREGVQSKLTDVKVELGMRYGEPSMERAIRSFMESGVDHVVLFPLYPQYSLAATQSSVAEAKDLCEAFGANFTLSTVPAFFGARPFVDAFAEVGKRALAGKKYDCVLFSYHGLPESQIRSIDPFEQCKFNDACCEAWPLTNERCYRAQCFATTRALAERLHIPREKYRVGFQSRLTNRWIQPFSDEFYRNFAKEGVKDLIVFCPSFVADCLETVEEVAIRGKKEFLQHGGRSLTLVPSLNSEPVWIDAVVEMARDHF